MARYFFDFRDDDGVFRDDEGLLMDTPREAENEAIKSLAEIARDGLPDGDHREFAVAVRDEHGRLLEARLVFAIERTRLK